MRLIFLPAPFIVVRFRSSSSCGVILQEDLLKIMLVFLLRSSPFISRNRYHKREGMHAGFNDLEAIAPDRMENQDRPKKGEIGGPLELIHENDGQRTTCV